MSELFKKYREQIAYLFFGVVTTIVSFGSHILFVNLGISLFVTGILAWILAVSVAFVTNRLWVFESQADTPKEVLKEAVSFFASRGLLGGFEVIAIPLISDYVISGVIFSTPGIDARVIVSVLVVAGNYFISKFWIFKGETHEKVS